MKKTSTQPTDHNLAKLWKECATDPGFMPNFKLLDNILNIEAKYFYNNTVETLLQDDPNRLYNYNQHSYLYRIFKLVIDYKYFHTPPKKEKLKPIISSLIDPYWIKFIKEMRLYLGFPGSDHIGDTIWDMSQYQDFSIGSRRYLKLMFE